MHVVSSGHLMAEASIRQILHSFLCLTSVISHLLAHKHTLACKNVNDKDTRTSTQTNPNISEKANLIGVNEHEPNCLLSSLDEYKTQC